VDYPTALVAPHELVEIPPEGVAIRSVQRESPAATAELTTHMLVSAVGGRKVATPAQFYEAVAGLSGNVVLTVRRPEGAAMKVVVGE
jgi:S1-C subfamily serine protease